MAEIELTADALIVHITGVDRFLSLKSRVEVPLAHVASVGPAADEAHRVFHGIRAVGTNLPGVITTGTFVQHGEWSFWDVHDPDHAIEIRLHDEGYARLVIGVDDPASTIAAIDGAIVRSRPPSTEA
jgi:hypothetical protein